MIKHSFAERFPEIAKEWHPTKNGDLKPEDVSSSYKDKVWWFYPYDDPKTGRHVDFEWRRTVHNRAIQGAACPFPQGTYYKGFNDVRTVAPELVSEWSDRNDKQPEDVLATDKHKYWWHMKYTNPKTGETRDLEWRQSPFARIIQKHGCTYLSGTEVLPGFNDLATTHPKIAKLWHPQNKLKPTEVTAGANKKVLWLQPYDDPETGRHHDFVWSAYVYSMTAGAGCPYLTGNAVWPGYNDLATTRPDIAKLWSPNNKRKVTEVSAGSNKRALWMLPYDDPRTGQHFDFEWPANIVDMCQDSTCPYVSGHATWPGYNDLESQYPEVAAEWNYERNHGVLPSQVYMHAHKKFWWKCPKGHEFRMLVKSRTYDGTRCQECEKIRRNRGL